MKPVALALLALLGFPGFPGGEARAEERAPIQLYLRETVYVEGPLVTVGDLAVISGATEQERGRVAACRLPTPLTRGTLLSPRSLRSILASAGLGSASVSGPRTALVPAAGLEARQKLFWERLLRAVDAAEGPRDARVEVEVLATRGVAPSSVGADLRFTALTVESRSGYAAGAGTLVYQSGGAEGSAEVWLHTFVPLEALGGPAAAGLEIDLSAVADLWARGGTAEADSGAAGAATGEPQGARKSPSVVKAGDSVTILFHRGSVTVATQGRAQTGGGMLDTVTVRPAGGGRTFAGRVVSPTEVAVEVP